jgi:hypothetical protein
VSRRDRGPQVGVDFAPPRAVKRTQPTLALLTAILVVAAIGVAVTQLLLR